MSLNNGDKLGGFVGQKMGGSKLVPPVPVAAIDTSANGSFTATVATWITLYAWGAGGAGFLDGSSGHNTACSGGGAGAGKKTRLLAAGQTVSWALTNGDAGNAVITLPDGTTLTAQGGQNATSFSAGTFGAGGMPFGTGASWDKAKRGGDGTQNTTGLTGQDGAAGGAATSNGYGGFDGGGGGAAGFKEEPFSPQLTGTAGLNGVGGTTTHAGGHGGGGAGPTSCRVVLIAVAA